MFTRSQLEANLGQLNANLAQVGSNLASKTLPKGVPRGIPRATYVEKPKTLNFEYPQMVLLGFWCPQGALGGQISLKNR